LLERIDPSILLSDKDFFRSGIKSIGGWPAVFRISLASSTNIPSVVIIVLSKEGYRFKMSSFPLSVHEYLETLFRIFSNSNFSKTSSSIIG